jgi:hypothetical protein
MTTYQIKDVPISQVKPNPHRDLATYPWIEDKVEQLMRSMRDVGFWEGVIARPILGNYETAFGHHRIEAARRINLKSVPLILRNLSDQDMIKFMGRENGEDYRSDFLIMLNTWEGAVRFTGNMFPVNDKAIDIAKLLGWVHPHSGGQGLQMSWAAAACASAYELVQAGHLSRGDLRGLSARDARELVVVTHKDIEDIQRAAQQTKLPGKDVAKAKAVIARSAKATAEDIRAGKVLKKHIRTEVRLNTLRDTRRTAPKLLPLFATFSKAVITKIDNMLSDDRAAQHINQIVFALPDITLEEDHALLRDLHHSLDQLGKRAAQAVRRTTPNKVVTLKALGDS